MSGFALEAIVTGLFGVITFAYLDRPRGGLSPACKSLLDIRPSPLHGRGVFATQVIRRDTILGEYPGRRRSPQDMALKAYSAPQCKSYVWNLIPEQGRSSTSNGNDQVFLDPTDESGHPSAFPRPGPLWFPLDVTLSFINEPPRGYPLGCNVDVLEDLNALTVYFKASRDIMPGEELFVDYGRIYDRSGYNSVTMEEEEMAHEKETEAHLPLNLDPEEKERLIHARRLSSDLGGRTQEQPKQHIK
jgi:hypothetical protein